MNDNKNINKLEESESTQNNVPFNNAVDEIDEELLALSPPPPNPRLLLLIILIFCMTVVMMVWFFPELKYFLSAFREPVKLGEAADIEVESLAPNRQAELHGFPLMQRTLTFKEGVKWFMLSNNTRKLSPLAGQPNIYVQWTESTARKAYRDPETNPGELGPPSSFKGQLATRQSMGANYEKIWVFYDCLKYHYIGRCNRCIGKNSMDDCRNTFVCEENAGKETCLEITSRSETDLSDEIAKAERSGDKKTEEHLRQLKSLQNEIAVQARFVELEELDIKTGRLQNIAAKKKSSQISSLYKIRATLLNLRFQELKLRAVHALRTTSVLSEESKQKLHSLSGELKNKKTEEESLVSQLKIMKTLVRIGESLHRWNKRTEDIIAKAKEFPPSVVEKLSAFDPNAKKGSILLSALSSMESDLASVKKNAPNEGENRDEVPSSDNAVDDKHVVKLTEFKERLDDMMSRLSTLSPGQLPELEQWASKPDVLGDVPEPLMENRVMENISEIERMLASTTPNESASDETFLPLARRMNESIDKLAALRTEIKAIPETPGFHEMEIEKELSSISSVIESGITKDNADALAKRINMLIADMTIKGVYLAKLKGAEKEAAMLSKLLSEERLKELKVELQNASSTLEPIDYVLIDGEIPLDKLWVVAVYLILMLMLIVNIRKILLFVEAYRK